MVERRKIRMRQFFICLSVLAKLTQLRAAACHSRRVLMNGESRNLRESFSHNSFRTEFFGANKGYISVLAGKWGCGYEDGVGTNAEFNLIMGLAFDETSGTVWISDNFPESGLIRKLDIYTKVVSTLAGDAYNRHTTPIDAKGTSAGFIGSRGLARDSSGILYVADTAGSNKGFIRRVDTTTAVVTTLFNVSAIPRALRLSSSIAFDSQHNQIYSCYYDDARSTETFFTISTLNNAVVTLLTHWHNVPTALDFTISSSSDDESDFIIDSLTYTQGWLYATQDTFIYRLNTTNGAATVYAGTGSPGYRDGEITTYICDGLFSLILGNNTQALFGGHDQYYPLTLSISSDSAGNLYVADALNNAVRVVTSAGQTYTMAGDPDVFPKVTSNLPNGYGSSAFFDYPTTIAVSADGNYVLVGSDADIDPNNFMGIMAVTVGPLSPPPTAQPTLSHSPTAAPSRAPSAVHSGAPTLAPSPIPTVVPSQSPSTILSHSPTNVNRTVPVTSNANNGSILSDPAYSMVIYAGSGLVAFVLLLALYFWCKKQKYDSDQEVAKNMNSWMRNVSSGNIYLNMVNPSLSGDRKDFANSLRFDSTRFSQQSGEILPPLSPAPPPPVSSYSPTSSTSSNYQSSRRKSETKDPQNFHVARIDSDHLFD